MTQFKVPAQVKEYYYDFKKAVELYEELSTKLAPLEELEIHMHKIITGFSVFLPVLSNEGKHDLVCMLIDRIRRSANFGHLKKDLATFDKTDLHMAWVDAHLLAKSMVEDLEECYEKSEAFKS